MITDRSELHPQTLKTEDQRSLKRQALQTSAEKYMTAIKEQVGDLKESGKAALVIGGIVMVGYIITEMLLPEADEYVSNDQKNNSYKANNEDSMFASMLKGVATTVLLTIAREQLMKLLERLPTDEPTNPAQ